MTSLVTRHTVRRAPRRRHLPATTFTSSGARPLTVLNLRGTAPGALLPVSLVGRGPPLLPLPLPRVRRTLLHLLPLTRCTRSVLTSLPSGALGPHPALPVALLCLTDDGRPSRSFGSAGLGWGWRGLHRMTPPRPLLPDLTVSLEPSGSRCWARRRCVAVGPRAASFGAVKPWLRVSVDGNLAGVMNARHAALARVVVTTRMRAVGVHSDGRRMKRTRRGRVRPAVHLCATG
ncbi:MAG: hypothetical protein JW940_37115 [Polyangiaceae bacterium]|nr:hypothetical protein [Polyangiaceae bacterium]